MKKLIKYTLIAFLFAFVILSGANADPISETLTFAWDQDEATLAVLDHWELYWSDVAGGPYDKIAEIPYGGGTSGSYQSDQPITVEGKIGEDTVKYFVMIACSETECSSDSNEVSHNFGQLPIGSPFNFTVTVTVE